MFENLNNFLFKVSMILFFIGAMTLFLLSQGKITELIDLGESSYLNSHVLSARKKETEAYYVLGYEIISQKISFETMNIIVEGIRIKTKNDLLTIKQDKKYSRVIEFDDEGQVQKLLYEEH